MESIKQVQIGLSSQNWSRKEGLPSISSLLKCILQKRITVRLTYVDDCVIVSHKQDTITSLISSVKNGPENYVFTDEGDVSNITNWRHRTGHETFYTSSQGEILFRPIKR